LIDGAQDRVGAGLARREGKWQRGGDDLCSDRFAHPSPDTQHGAVLVIGTENLVAFGEWKAIGDDIHAVGRVLDKGQIRCRGADECGQPLPRCAIGRFILADVEVHRVRRQAPLPFGLGFAHWFRRRAKRTVI
jgi:hypothetical protein